jgi:outer membrane cobalamin receptor
VGGVVQIFTRRGEQGLQFDAAATAGSNRYRQLAGGMRFGQGAFDGSVQLQHT